ncbi:FAD/NAD(P)-binding domain-containing protein [Melanomma pulvis-pyrius CBS 109.77]|uniref:FAD/NAD(P)-binding domain-containing protein n=1 Tax=Melanomma pulvis-pyrius CBS 109.77 TaxID=1314802 RepID=A0A6A6XRX1_9PLEO|nr:FAD/NAD(P)-binding domain-containing protein [Melanomma pulvis-pyrius CBS 109.77]
MFQSALITVFSFAIGATLAKIDERNFPVDHIITKDVAIIGGGASGTYAAVRLREDFDTSIILIEKKPRLGGHVDTYVLPNNQTTIEYGVQSYIRYKGATDFFTRLGVDILPSNQRRLTSVNVDIETGKALTGYTPPTPNATTEALQRWLTLLEKYEAFMEPGYWNFPAPNSIPSDLLVPFGEFAKTHSLEDAAPRIMVVSNVGLGGLKDVLTLYVMQAFGAPITRGMLAPAPDGLFVPDGSNSLLYQHAYTLLKKDVLLSSYVSEAERTNTEVRLVVQAPDGEYLIKAKRLLFTPPPSLKPSLQSFAVDKKEKEVFREWVPTWSFVGIMNIPCIPENYSIAYISSAAVPSDHLAIRDYPYTLRLDSTGPSGLGLFRVLFGTNFTITTEEAKQIISEDVQKLVAVGTVNYTGDCTLDFRAFADHNSVLWPLTSEQLRQGFVQKLNALQGHRSTWYTGSSWCGHYSSNVWAFTDTVLPKLLKGLKG